MAAIRSLGIHRPSAVPYLVEEGVLPPDPPESTYTWQTVPREGNPDEEEEEELLTTRSCVVMSSNGAISRLFRFDVENEPVVQAVLTRFSTRHENPTPITSTGVVLPTPGGDDTRKLHQARAQLGENEPKSGNVKQKYQHTDLNPHTRNMEDERALVVILKTQAHVFFLSGTSHIVHLPFEVSSALALQRGVLLQRKIVETSTTQPTPLLPSVPLNSFAFSNPNSSWIAPSSQSLQNLVNSQGQESEAQPFEALFRKILAQSSNRNEVDLPRHFCLTDPLTDMGIVVGGTAPQIIHPKARRKSVATNVLDAHEDFLYISSTNELDIAGSTRFTRPPLLLAVTHNSETRMNTLWTISYPKVDFQDFLKGGSNSVDRFISRRRSSYGPGTATGATTPAVRNSLGAGESFAGPVDTIGEKSLVEDEIALAAQLDPAFENPGLPAKSSRRVSSLLARSDLSINHDRTVFPDLATSHAAVTGTRRGPSFGNHALRSSFGVAGMHPRSSRRSAGGSQSGHDGESWGNLSQATQEFDSDDDRSNSADVGLHRPARGLRNEMVLMKAHSFHASDQHTRSVRVPAEFAERPQVFILNPPNSQAGNAESQLVLCMHDRQNFRLSILQVHILTSSPRKKPNHTNEKSGAYAVHVSQIRNCDGVVGACKVSDGNCSRMLVLSQTRDGSTELTLQAPWSTLKTIKLPDSLLVHHPYREAQFGIPRRKREGGLKRILSGGPEALISVEHANGLNNVDIRDSRGFRHRIEIHMNPKNILVRNALNICELILPREDTELEPLSRAWWDIMSWIQLRSDQTEDLEWIGFVVLISAMFVPFIEEYQPQSTLRQKKRKGGLLRSSSGASVDLDSRTSLMETDGDSCSSSPAWLHTGAWAWTQESEQPMSSPSNSLSSSPRQSRPIGQSLGMQSAMESRSTFFLNCTLLAREFAKSTDGELALGKKGYLPTAVSKASQIRRAALPTVLIGLHLLREELKLNLLATNELRTLTPLVAQLGGWLDWESWSCRGNSYYMLESADMDHWIFDQSVISDPSRFRQVMEPPSILKYIEEVGIGTSNSAFATLADICPQPQSNSDKVPAYSVQVVKQLTPRTSLVLQLLDSQSVTAADRIINMSESGLSLSMLDSFPEGVAAPLRASIATLQVDPVSTWPSDVLNVIDRDDINTLESLDQLSKPRARFSGPFTHESLRDFRTISNSMLEGNPVSPYDSSADSDRQAVTRMIFKDDQRFAEAMKLVHPLKPAVARCVPEPDWSDTDLLEAQQEMVKVIAIRTLSVSPGRGMLIFSARYPLLTEKFPIHGFTLSCIMKPANTTVTADRNIYTEEKVSWAFFHAGVEAGLSISRGANNIDTSWILYNKPQELNNRHAGFLLALGLNGHLKSIAKWVAFKYLTPKHTMTSIGLLLGLSASYLGTMDTLITRLLSVHVTRMLPLGAAELNLAPLTQTTGIMAIGLLYANTQHRRMSEIMLSEIENIVQDENTSPIDNLRDEGYRLAAGFALGYINIGQGRNLKGLHDMRIVERLLAIAVGTKKVDLVHILDKATAAAVIAIALVFMKTEDEALSRKIDIPDTIHQFEYVRPDIFLLRTLARHLIMWDQISATTAWMRKSLPLVYQPRVKLTGIRLLTTDDMPLLNIIAGLCFSIGLRFAGSARQDVRNLLGHYLDQFIRICRLPALNYDGKLTRVAARNCQDVVALSAAAVMAGTGDLYILRRLRSLHARADPDTPYGSHLATHMAIGVLFLAGGTHSFSTSNVAIASLICAFYPLFPTSVLDNKSHLQAFRHFWVLAAEPRCVVVRDADTRRPLSVPIIITLRSGIELSATAPCLLPGLDSISKIQTDDPEYWRVTLDLSGNPAHLPFFRRYQSIYVRHRAAYDAKKSIFSVTLQAMNDVQSAHQATKQVFEWIFDLPSFKHFDRAERTLVLPVEGAITLHSRIRSTVIDDRLVLEKACLGSTRAERLWNLRLLFAWADGVRKEGEDLGWLRRELVESLRAAVSLMGNE